MPKASNADAYKKWNAREMDKPGKDLEGQDPEAVLRAILATWPVQKDTDDR